MSFIQKGSKPNSYLINLFGIRIRFRNIFAYKNNKIILIDKKGNEKKVNKIKGLRVNFIGSNSTVKVYYPCPKFQNAVITCRNNARVTIGGSKYYIKNCFLDAAASNSSITLGKNCFVRGGYIVTADKAGLNINIGDECLIANSVKITATDFHTVYDLNSKKPLNPPEDINIGKHCWICQDVTVAKGTVLADDTIVAAKSYVTGTFEKTNTIIGGVPARIIKENTSWCATGYDKYVESLPEFSA